ncbi:MAG: sugar ABC transporter ATP-binding protein [Vicinamibacteraceae bacterium]
MTPLLSLSDIAVAFGGVQAVRGVSFDVRPGEVHALVGENGAGKSTLIRVMTGAIRANSGTVSIAGQPVERPEPTRMRALGVAPIYQQPALLPDLSVAENLAFGLEQGRALRRIDWRARRARATGLLARVGVSLDLDRPAGTLRMAEQQLVEIARALGTQAKVLLLDEPTAALTDVEAARLFTLVRGLRADGVGCVYISHRLEEVMALADRVSVLRDGRLMATLPIGEVTRDGMVRLMVGRDVDMGLGAPPLATGDSVATPKDVLTLRDVSCAASRIAGVTLRVAAGEIVGLAGLVGAGRTELARVLFGLTPADGGSIAIDGKARAIRTPAEAVRLGIAYVPEDRRQHGVIGAMSVAANTTLASLGRVARFGFLDGAAERTTAQRFVGEFAIRTPSIDAAVGTLSGGNQQKVALARWLATKPRLLILDEPTQGVDIGAKAEIHRLIRTLAGDGLAILLISSELTELLGLAHRIGVMRGGRLVGELARAEATEERLMSLALGHTPLPVRAQQPGHEARLA